MSGDVFLRHRLRIAAQTLKLTDEGARILGGMTKQEARDLLRSQIRYDKRHTKKPGGSKGAAKPGQPKRR